MAFTTSLWTVDGTTLHRQERVALDAERRLEDWIAADLSLLGEDLLLIGRQIRTTGGPLDILAMDAEGTPAARVRPGPRKPPCRFPPA